MGANLHTNGGQLLKDLDMPDYRSYALAVEKPGVTSGEATRVLGGFLRDVMKRNLESRNFRVFSPDENNSNRLDAILDVTNRAWEAELVADDDHLAPDGRVMEILSEHTCQGWLEGYLLTGRHGFFSCYEAFIHIVDSMFNQHAKWLKTTRHIPWRKPIASLNYLLTSHVWRQDHNGLSHQDPGFIDHVVNKKADVVRVYLPPDANCLLSVADHCLRSRHYVNVIVAGKQPAPQYLSMEEAIRHCTAGIGIWEWASNDEGGEPDVVMACAGDVPTLETLAAVDLLRTHCPDLKIRVVNVVDLMTLEPNTEHPHGLSDKDFDTLFTTDKPIIFAYHGYPWLIHRLTYRRTNHRNIHVRGYKEEGTTTTTFDMVVMNDLDRFHLAGDVVDRVPSLGYRAAHFKHTPARQVAGASSIHPRIRRRSSRSPRLGLVALNTTRSGRSRSPMNILVINAGSSTLKYKLFQMQDRESGETVLAEGSVEQAEGSGIVSAAETAIEKCAGFDIHFVSHRMVHGGSRFYEPTRVTEQVLSELKELKELDPLHNPTETALIEAALRLLPDAPSIAVFDTAFHRTMPEIAWRYALPRDLADRLNLRRYGFHGLSHQYVSERLLEVLNRQPEGSRLIVCHLGNGASVCAVKDGKSVDTSMGMTPLEGLIMGTRSGDVDPRPVAVSHENRRNVCRGDGGSAQPQERTARLIRTERRCPRTGKGLPKRR